MGACSKHKQTKNKKTKTIQMEFEMIQYFKTTKQSFKIKISGERRITSFT